MQSSIFTFVDLPEVMKKVPEDHLQSIREILNESKGSAVQFKSTFLN